MRLANAKREYPEHDKYAVLLGNPVRPGLEAAILGSVLEGRTRIVVDCSRLTYVSSSGLRALLAGLKAARGAGGGCALAALADEPKRVIVTTGFDRLFLLGDTVSEAVACLLSPAGET